ncbi:predicted protein [Chaetoceros tenuissimus]|uniref:Uncharacterized protein n=1 Tax=Chaetoceros tenuissimus TaxID=426638 RepID=A0AAD3CQ38_9STRA|nr:predicted protein [Chaetoceros tenuissimus]
MDQAIFKTIQVDTEFCVLLDVSLDGPCSHESNCSRTKGRPNYVEIYRLIDLFKSIESERFRSWYSIPIPENMDQDDWMRFLRRMADAQETYALEGKTYDVLIFLIVLSSALPVFVPFLIGWCDNETKIQGKCSKEPPLWWNMLFGALALSWCRFFEKPVSYIVIKVLEAPKKIWRKSQEKVVKDMQLAFKCSGYSAEIVLAQCCGVTSRFRYIRFSPITKSEREHFKSRNKDFQDVYNLQKDEAKNKPYDPAYWKPLEGEWEETNRFGLGKITHRWIFNRTQLPDALRSHYECKFHTIAFSSIPSKRSLYHLEGHHSNLLLSDDATSTLPSEIFRLAGNDNSVVFYRVGCYQIWKVEGSICMQFNLEGNLVLENDMVSTSFWSSQEPTNVYRKVTNTDVETNPMAYGQLA